MKKYNISKPRNYTDNQGNQKTYWDKVGEMIEFEKENGSVSRIIKIPAIGLEASIFEEKPKEDRQTPPRAPQQATGGVAYPPEEYNPNDVPF